MKAILGGSTASSGGDMVLASVQSVTGLKTFDKLKLAMKGTSTGVTTLSTANTSATDYTATLPAKDGTIAMTSDIVVSDGDKGDITVSGSGTTWTIDDASVTLAKQANLAQNTIIGRVTASTGVPEALSATNVRTIINVADGANVGVVPNSSITGATKTKITYDTKGLVTSGADATTADIADSTNKRYVTDANLTTIGNQSGTNTGDSASIPVGYLDTDGTLAGNSDSKVATQKATKTYVDAVAQGLSPKPSAIVATTTALATYTYANGSSGVGATITAVATGVVAIDGHNLALSDIVLVKDETAGNAPYNGLYNVTVAGAVGVALVLTRHTSMDTTSEFSGGYVFVESGTVNTAAGFVCTNTGSITVGTTAVSFTQFSGAGEITAGDALTKTANTLDVAVDGSTIEVSSDALRVKDSGITYAKIQNVSATDKVLGRSTAGAGVVEEIATTGSGNVVRATSPTLVTPALGTPSALVLTNATSLPVAGITASTSTALGVGSLELGHASDTTITRTGAGAIAVEGTAVLLSGGALGTPSSGTLTNATGLPVAGITASTSTALGVGSVELGHATDTTIARVSAGVASIEGVNILTVAGGTLTGNITLGENTSIALDPAGSADGKYSGTTIAGTGGATIAFGDLVTLDKDDSRWELVDISVAAAATGDARGLLGMAVTSSSDGAALTILLVGQIRADANFPALTIGAPVYASTTGDIVVTQPTTTDHVIRIVGYALTADEIYFNPGAVWTTHI